MYRQCNFHRNYISPVIDHAFYQQFLQDISAPVHVLGQLPPKYLHLQSDLSYPWQRANVSNPPPLLLLCNYFALDKIIYFRMWPILGVIIMEAGCEIVV